MFCRGSKVVRRVRTSVNILLNHKFVRQMCIDSTQLKHEFMHMLSYDSPLYTFRERLRQHRWGAFWVQSSVRQQVKPHSATPLPPSLLRVILVTWIVNVYLPELRVPSSSVSLMKESNSQDDFKIKVTHLIYCGFHLHCAPITLWFILSYRQFNHSIKCEYFVMTYGSLPVCERTCAFVSHKVAV